MDITKLNSFNTVADDPRGALINMLLVTKDGQGYSMIDQKVKSALDDGRLIGGTDESNEATEKANFRSTSSYVDYTYDLMYAMVKSFIRFSSKMSAAQYDKSVKMVLIWLAHTEFWRLLITDEDSSGEKVEPIYPKDYATLASELYLLVYNKDKDLANELMDEASKLGYSNLANIVDDLGSEVFYLTITKRSRENWEALVNRYESINKDLDKYGQGPANLYKKYYSRVGGKARLEYKVLVDVYNKIYENDKINSDNVSKFARQHIEPYMFSQALSDPEVIAIKSLMVNED